MELKPAGNNKTVSTTNRRSILANYKTIVLVNAVVALISTAVSVALILGNTLMINESHAKMIVRSDDFSRVLRDS